jgi:ribosomal protein S18 acetylase RimI-like enzyme
MLTQESTDPAAATLSVSLQPATTADVCSILPWMADFYEHEHIAFERGASEAALRELTSTPTSGSVFLLHANDRAVGYAVLARTYSLEFGGHAAFLDELYVQPDARGLGVGSLALRLLQEEAKRTGARAIALEVHSDNTQADALYRREGFVFGGRRLLTRRL